MSIESPSPELPAYSNYATGLTNEFITQMRTKRGIHRSVEDIHRDIGGISDSILRLCSLRASDGFFCLKSNVDYRAQSGATITYSQRTYQEQARGLTIPRQAQEIAISGLATITTMLGSPVYDRVLISRRTPCSAPPYLLDFEGSMETGVMFYGTDANDLGTFLTYCTPSLGSDTAVRLERNTRAISYEDLAITLAIAEMALAQPLKASTP